MCADQKGKVLIEIVEEINTVLDHKDEVSSIQGSGVLSIVNTSKEHRLWNVKLSNQGIKEAIETTLPPEASKETIEPGQKWDLSYDISNLKAPLLRFKEVIDTSTNEGGVNTNFVINTPDITSISLILENTSEKPLQRILLKKQIPDYLKEVEIAGCDSGNPKFDIDSKLLTWEVPFLEPKNTVKLEIKSRPEIVDPEPKSGNDVEIVYEAENNKRSYIEPSMEALTETMMGIDQEEDDQKPGWWKCEVEFENESDFEVTVKNLQVKHNIATGEEVLVDISPSEVVSPKGTWIHQFSVESPTVPSLSPKLEFTTNYIVPTKIIGKIVQEAKTFKVLRTVTEKKIDPPSVNANANTDINVTVSILNTGTASIDSIAYSDKIPKDFEPPLIEDVKCIIINELGETEKTLLKENALIKLAPEGKDITVPHEINIDFHDLDELFLPKKKLVVTYPIIGRNPQPKVVYETPVEIKSYTKPKGPPYADAPAEVPTIGITYVKRKIKAAKSISPAGENAFNVTIKISNKGGIEIEDIKVIEEIPNGFNAGSFSPEELKPEFIQKGDGAQLTWNIKRLDPGQELRLKYISEGTGEFPRTEPKVIIAEPESLKKPAGSEAASPSDDATNSDDYNVKEQAIISEIFSDLVRELNKIVSCLRASELLIETREKLLSQGKSAIILREVTKESEEIKKLGDKMLTGELLDGVLSKIQGWSERLAN
ncbi:MAG: hypothetical protein ACTSVI_01180 [Promethearchaeota archaeon]